MSAKYAQEMILIPKPSCEPCRTKRSTGHPRRHGSVMATAIVSRSTDHGASRRSHDETSRRHERGGRPGPTLPSTLPGQGPNNSDYFRLQGQLKNMPAQPVKRSLAIKPSTGAAAAVPKPAGRPPTPTSVEEALQQRADIEKRLDEFKEKAKQDTEEALKWGDAEAIKKADYNWRIVTSAVDDIREENGFFNEPSLVDQVIYGEEEEKKRRDRAREAHERRLDKLWRQLKDMYPNQQGKGSKPPIWQKPRGWIQE